MCYRRADSEEMVDRIYETLATEFGDAAVFRDIDTIPLGVVFPVYIQNALRDCPVVLVFIGKDWVNCVDGRGRRRIDDPSDHVRIEVETALALPGARVIPVFVKRAEVPNEEELPESLRPLRWRSGVTIRSAGPDYKQDIARLSKTLAEGVKGVVAVRQFAAEQERRESEAGEREATEWRERQIAEQRQTEEAAEQERRVREAEANEQQAREQKERERPRPAPIETPARKVERPVGGEESRSGSSAGKPERGADLRYDLQIRLDEAAFGCEKEFEVSKFEACAVCKGAGAMPGSLAGTCGNCGGDGRVMAQSSIKLRIPAGIEEGARLRARGSGEAGLRGGVAGDLYVVVQFKKHDVFERKENDLFCEIPVVSSTLAKGGEVLVPTLNGQAKLKVPAGAQSGTALKLRGMGMPVFNSSVRGDLIVRVVDSTPGQGFSGNGFESFFEQFFGKSAK